MTEPQIIQTLKERQELPTIPGIISEFHIGYQMAVRIRATVCGYETERIYCSECSKLISELPVLCRGVILCESCARTSYPEHPALTPAMELDLFEL